MNLRWCSLALEDELSHHWSAYPDGHLQMTGSLLAACNNRNLIFREATIIVKKLYPDNHVNIKTMVGEHRYFCRFNSFGHTYRYYTTEFQNVFICCVDDENVDDNDDQQCQL
jgi:hypothetical protein